MSSVDSDSSEPELGLVEVLVAEELGFDSGTASVGVVAVCGLLIAVRCAKIWSYVVVFGAGGGLTSFGFSVGLEGCLQHGAGAGFDGLEMIEISYSVLLDVGLGKVETVWLLLSAI